MNKPVPTLLAFLSFGPFARAAEPKQVLVCTVTYGYRHDSIPIAEKTLRRLGEESGAFKVVELVSQSPLPRMRKPGPPQKPGDLKPDADDRAKAKMQEEMQKFASDQKKFEEAIAKWNADEGDKKQFETETAWNADMKERMTKLSPENLRAQGIDAVIFANTTGDLPLPDREGFIKWIEEGHGFMAVHSASDTFHGFPGYIQMLQGEFETHGLQVPADLIAADQAHPANAGIGTRWDLKQEEMYLIKSQDRAKVRSLWYLNHHPNKTEEKGFFPVSWCRKAGQGRVFYTSLGHREDLWSDDPALADRKNPVETSRQYHAHLLGGIKWTLGLAEGSTEPNIEAAK